MIKLFSMDMPKVKIYTDGACSHNPGKGGYGIVLIYNKNEEVIQKTISKGFLNTTNNRMELLAVVEALSALKKPCEVELYSDSKYVIDAINKNWLGGWIKRGWKTADKSPVKNIDLWQKFLEAKKLHKISFIWVKGHAENKYNNLCDKMAVSAYMGENLEEDTGFRG